jgi:Zeta toxin
MQRLLLDKTNVEEFMEGLFPVSDSIFNSNIASKIADAQTLLLKDKNQSTLYEPAIRIKAYQNDDARWLLRTQIVVELFTLTRLKSDDEIKIEIGGAKPNSPLQYNKQAFVITGPPASGKSGISEKIAENFGAIILDSDYAKRKLPEYDSVVGAARTHSESGMMILGSTYLNDFQRKFATLLDLCSNDGINIVIPKIGDSAESLVVLCNKLKIFGYEVHLTLLELDRKKATQRAVKRFHTSNRYVPLSLIYDVYGNEPTLAYYRIKNNHPHDFASLGMLSNDVGIDESPFFIEGNSLNPASLFRK